MPKNNSSLPSVPFSLRRSLLWFSFCIIILYALASLAAPGQIAFAAGTITGTVFRDYDGDGLQDTREPGVGNVTIKAYDSSGASATATTFAYVCAGSNSPAGLGCTGAGAPALGSYSIDTSALAAGTYRLEMTWTQSYFQDGTFNSASASGSKSSVRFVSGGSSNVNFALSDPAQYTSTTTPTLATTEMISGTHTGSTGPAVVSFPYTSTGTTAPTTESTHALVGSTWGITYSRSQGKYFVSAFEKRMVDFGPSGAGAIYAIVPGGASDGTLFATIPGAGGGHNSFTCGGGSGSCDGTGGAWDSTASTGLVGKSSLGALVISDDDTMLYTVNLATKHVFSVSVPGGVVTDVGAVPHPTCTNGTDRPFGLGFHDGKLYMGGVCDASSGTSANLSAYVYEWDTTTAFASASLVLAFPLNYDRTCSDTGGYNSPIPFCDAAGTTTRGLRAVWNPWTDNINTAITTANAANANGSSYPMPMLTKIQFDNSDMIIGLRDRMGDMVGVNDPGPNTANPVTGNRYNDSAGDILRASPCPTGSTTCTALNSAGWVLETNSHSNPTGIFGPTTQNNGQGPGTGCTPYSNGTGCARFFIGNDGISQGLTQQYLSVGGVLQVPGFSEVVTTSADPVGTWSNGTIQLSDSTGARVRSYQIYCTINPLNPACTGPAVTGTFGKSNGLGDLALVSAPAPLEIGNRVWRDDDGDGIQDPNELGISGLTIRLYEGANLIGTTTTDSSGEYYFSSATLGNWGTDGVPNTSDDTALNGLKPSTNGITHTYQVRIEQGAGNNTALMTGLTTTTQNAAQPANGNASATTNDPVKDVADSDASVSGGNFIISYTTGGIGVNNHGLDFGLAPLGSIGNRVWIDEDSNGYQDKGEDGIANVTVELFNSAGTSLGTRVTDSNGNYLFTGLAAGTYFVHINSGIPSGMTQTTTYPNAGADFHNQDQTTGVNDFGYQVVLGAGQDNLSADFGYNWNPTSDVNTGGATNATAALGDRVWYDTNNNGRQDHGEVGISGVTVTLINPGADLIFGTGDDTTSTTTTNSTGYYIFDGLTPGAYKVQIGATGNTGAGQPLNGLTQSGDPDHWGTTGTNDNLTTSAVVLGPGDVFLDADFGYTGGSVGSIGDFVWLDRNPNGIGPNGNGNPGNDNTELGIAGVTVALIRDTNNDGVWQAGEPIIATTVTSDGNTDVDGDGSVDALGFYRFRGLPVTDGAGTDDYIVWVNDTARKLDGLTATYDQNGATPATGLVTGLGISRVADLTTTAVTNQDFGYTPDNSGTQASRTTVSTTNTGAIGDRVWLDVNSNDVQDATESGIQGVRVYLYQDSNGNGTLDSGEPIIASTYTGPDGYYLFPNLVDTDGTGTDDYIVQVDTTTLPGGLTQTFDLNGSQTDSTSAATNLAGTILTHDFGYVGTGSIGNLVWNDVNADGDQDAGEVGISGVTLDLYYDANANGKIDAGEIKLGTTTTNGSGAYLFSGLPVNDGGNDAAYVVDVTDTADVLAGYWHSLGANPNTTTDTTGGEATALSHNDPVPVTLTTTVINNRNADFGYYVLPAALGNYVWNDANANGIQDSGEVGINNVTVQLTITYPGANGVIGTGGDDTVTTLRTVTGDNPNQAGTQTGWYSFDNLLQDEDYNGANTVGVGEPTFTISVVTADNTGALAGLVKTNINQGTGVAQDLLDSDAHSGVSATALEGQRSVDQQALGSSEGTLASYDFGYTAPVNLGNRIWYDVDNDGLYEPNGNDGNAGTTADNEVGINNVTVNLYRDTDGSGTFNAGDTLVATTATNSSGIYNFALLTPSIAATNSTKYLVVLPDTDFTSGGALVGYQNSTLTDAANADLDSRDHGLVSGTLGSTGGVVTTSGAVTVTQAGEPDTAVDTDGTSGNLTIDFGFYRLTLSGTVFTDTVTQNGTLDAGETSNAILTGITVKLYQDANDDDVADGAAVATTTTTAGGAYSFTNLPAGRYLVGVTQPTGWHSTIDTADQADNDDPVKGTDNNDNGHGTVFAEVKSRSLDLQAGSSASGNSVTVSTGTTSNDRLDFGMSQSPTAVEMGAVSAQANDDNSVTVTWATLNETLAMGFNVQRGDTKKGEFVSVNTDLIPALNPGSITGSQYTFTDTGTSSGHTYYYRIQLVHADSSTVETEPVKVKVGAACKGKLAAPAIIAPADNAKIKKGKIEFSWNAPDCVKHYHIEIRAGSTDGTVFADKNVKTTTFSTRKLEKGITYYWRVSSCNAKGKCVSGDWFSVRIKADKTKNKKQK